MDTIDGKYTLCMVKKYSITSDYIAIFSLMEEKNTLYLLYLWPNMYLLSCSTN